MCAMASTADPPPATTLHTAALVVTLSGDEETGPDAVLAGGGRILAVGEAASLAAAHPDAARVDHGDAWIMPGLRNGHGHVAGWPPDAPLEIFLLLRYGAEDEERTYRRTLATAAALVRSGVVWTHHLHYGDHAGAALRAYRDAGLRVQFCPGALDRYAIVPYDDGDRALLAALPADLAAEVRRRRPGKPTQPVERYLERWRALRDAWAGDDGVDVVLGPDNPQWCTDRCLLALREAGAPLHLHCQETAAQLALAVRALGESPVARLARLGALGPDVTLAHLTHASDDDIARVAAAGARVVWNPSSNLRLGSGVTRARDLAAAGVRLGMGVDGGGLADDGDLLAEVRLGALLQRVADTPAPALPNRDLLAAAAGRIAPGEPADLVVLDPLPGDDPVDAIVRRATARHVRAVYAEGAPLLRDGALVRVAEPPADDWTGAAPPPELATLAPRLEPYVGAALAGVARMDAAAADARAVSAAGGSRGAGARPRPR
jgi:5-methylthioadenosine/S-adenosylhomocysteine deaminase